jgi:hypothetical protein
MNKLPVARTVLDAYGFTFAQLGTIIGLIWFPTVVSTLLNFLPQLASGFGGANGAAATGTDQIEILAIMLLKLLLSAIVYVAVARQALGLRQGPAMFHFALGQPEFRVYGALLILYFLMAVLLIAPAEAQRIGGPASIVASYFVLPALALIVFLLVRIGWLIVPAIVIENKVDFGRVWAITRGNFWRLFAVATAVTIPLLMIFCTAAVALMQKDLQSVVLPVGPSDQKALEQQVIAIQEIVQRHTPELLFVALFLTPFALGLSLAASASAYRTLSGSADSSRTVAA